MNSSASPCQMSHQEKRNDDNSDIIKLHESNNAWKPSHRRGCTTDESEKLKQFVQGVLNKLTFQKFKILLSQLKKINLDTEENLSLLVDLIFENAILEPHFSCLYANLCKHLENIKVQGVHDPDHEISIISLMNQKCQHEINQESTDVKSELIGTVSSGGSQRKGEPLVQCEDGHQATRFRKLGAIRLFGELYKLNVPVGPMIDENIQKCLDQQNEESLECLSLLLKIVGKVLEKETSNPDSSERKVDVYFKQIQRIVNRCLLSYRIRFMLLDLIELKENDWIPRRAVNLPRTIDQIHKEIEKEKYEAQKLYERKHYKKTTSKTKLKKNKGKGSCIFEDDGSTSHLNCKEHEFEAVAKPENSGEKSIGSEKEGKRKEDISSSSHFNKDSPQSGSKKT